ncbi:hypothetical protein A3J15_01070 [Candidatus Roizmanbacteria bacterium RIFCSPLOWO2_02_FULL_38_10]|uniref:HIT domain-containing protein n=1 Tax=Candidatus Roizmanbacteria bacterium RIFCSPLOWO2_02_FULL_38_10 TaxID=1802074 RepID=A0A1F7JPB8_9BACT|nr:MAG: hypothetical protein A3J15_01070 [Candidatus Roizmanbacteria bacterium RIFCSPLOWO2_02_FULL_38_10]
MESCIFCKIAAGEIPCYKVYEDDDFLGFLDITPRTRGHTLLIPKKHFRFVYDVTSFSDYWSAALKLTKKIQSALKPFFITYVTHGLEVSHAHIHVIPRTESEIAFVPAPISLDKQELADIASKILNAA